MINNKALVPLGPAYLEFLVDPREGVQDRLTDYEQIKGGDMSRVTMISTVGQEYLTSNIEGGEFSYIKQAGSKEKLSRALGYTPNHHKLDIRFFDKESKTAVLIETKQNYVDSDVNQLREYVAEEKVLFPNNKIIAILANTTNEGLRVWKSAVDEEHEMPGETAIDTMSYYVSLFEVSRQDLTPVW